MSFCYLYNVYFDFEILDRFPKYVTSISYLWLDIHEWKCNFLFYTFSLLTLFKNIKSFSKVCYG